MVAIPSYPALRGIHSFGGITYNRSKQAGKVTTQKVPLITYRYTVTITLHAILVKTSMEPEMSRN